MTIPLVPAIIHDPFLKYRPFPANPTTLFQAHWHEIIASFIFYIIIQQISAPICSKLFGKNYDNLKKSTKINFDVHFTSMIQCIISILLFIPHLNNPHFQNRSLDPVGSLFGVTPFGSLCCSLTIGYFLWDILVCIQHFKLFGIGFLFHGIAAMFAFGNGIFVPYCQPWAGAFLTFELSTPFVNLNWFASHLPTGTFSDKFIIINGLLLMITFFSVRIVWGFYAVYQLYKDIQFTLNMINNFIPYSILILNLGLDCLNVFWFYKMVMIAKKKATGSSSTRKAAKEADKIE
ncbi:unnamed protein product [Candida verbasci]|uniref:TLC domain-containing protein n=1 Tax=Candida verbasci TaxID=1227364 RepID=A0A9W4TVX1_9ASCO|nr:unnamed protein product [Candida verbasci]